MMMGRKTFVQKINKEIENNKNVAFFANREKGTVFCVSNVTGKSTMAKCHNEDMFDYAYGRAVAYTKFMGREIEIVDVRDATTLSIGDTVQYNGKSCMYLGRAPLKMSLAMGYKSVTTGAPTKAFILLFDLKEQTIFPVDVRTQFPVVDVIK